MEQLHRRLVLGFAVVSASVISTGEASAASTPGEQAYAAHPIAPQISAITLGVRDLAASYRFYKDGLGLPAQRTPSDGIVFFFTTGTKLFLYPFSKLAVDAGVTAPEEGKRTTFSGVTLGHAVRTKAEVDRVLALAAASGGRLVKAAHVTSWGGYSGYFSDPDGYLWEVLYGPHLRFAPDGTVIAP